MKNRKKLIAALALIAFTLTGVPAMAAQDSVRKWGHWENMTPPAAGPEPTSSLITFTVPVQVQQPEHHNDPVIVQAEAVEPELPVEPIVVPIIDTPQTPDGPGQPTRPGDVIPNLDPPGMPGSPQTPGGPEQPTRPEPAVSNFEPPVITASPLTPSGPEQPLRPGGDITAQPATAASLAPAPQELSGSITIMQPGL